MKSSLLNKSKKDLSDYEKLIEEGYVLDVRGQWIPLNEKVKKERSFVKHLEAGEVLISGNWVLISDALKTQDNKIIFDSSSLQNMVSSDETVQIPIHFHHDDIDLSETSHDETMDSSDSNLTNTEQDFPPETIMIPADELLNKIDSNNQSANEKMQTSSPLTTETLLSDEDEFLMETIAIPLSKIPRFSASILESIEKKDDTANTWEISRQKRKKFLLKLSLTIIILGIAALAVIAFSNGSVMIN